MISLIFILKIIRDNFLMRLVITDRNNTTQLAAIDKDTIIDKVSTGET